MIETLSLRAPAVLNVGGIMQGSQITWVERDLHMQRTGVSSQLGFLVFAMYHVSWNIESLK